jgi:hypothetical protein
MEPERGGTIFQLPWLWPVKREWEREKRKCNRPVLRQLSKNPVVLRSADIRVVSISRTYTHLIGTMVAFTLLETLLFCTSLTQSIARALAGVNWMLVLGVLMVVGWR